MQALRAASIAVPLPAAAKMAQESISGFAIVDGSSMYPTFNPHGDSGRRDWVFFHRLRQHKRGDVVVMRSPDGEEMLIKRVVGLAGDVIQPRDRDTSALSVPAGHIWVEGDNPRTSRDSNSFGPVKQSLVDSCVAFRFCPEDSLVRQIFSPTPLRVEAVQSSMEASEMRLLRRQPEAQQQRRPFFAHQWSLASDALVI